MATTSLGITLLHIPTTSWLVAVSIIALQLFLESYTGFPFSTWIAVNSVL